VVYVIAYINLQLANQNAVSYDQENSEEEDACPWVEMEIDIGGHSMAIRTVL
jgi:hypothetical protein